MKKGLYKPQGSEKAIWEALDAIKFNSPFDVTLLERFMEAMTNERLPISLLAISISHPEMQKLIPGASGEGYGQYGKVLCTETGFASKLKVYHENLDSKLFPGVSLSEIFKSSPTFPFWFAWTKDPNTDYSYFRRNFDEYCKLHGHNTKDADFRFFMENVRQLYGSASDSDYFHVFFHPVYRIDRNPDDYILHSVAVCKQGMALEERRFAERYLTAFTFRVVEYCTTKLIADSNLTNSYLQNQARTRGHNLGHAVEHLLKELESDGSASGDLVGNENIAQFLRYYRSRDRETLRNFGDSAIRIPVVIHDKKSRPLLPNVIARTILADALPIPQGLTDPYVVPKVALRYFARPGEEYARYIPSTVGLVLSLPGGHSGVGFLRSILENLIRNSVKHANDKNVLAEDPSFQLPVAIVVDRTYETSRLSCREWAGTYDRLTIMIPSFAQGVAAKIYYFMSQMEMSAGISSTSYPGLADIKLSVAMLLSKKAGEIDSPDFLYLADATSALQTAAAPPALVIASARLGAGGFATAEELAPELLIAAKDINAAVSHHGEEILCLTIHLPRVIAAQRLTLQMDRLEGSANEFPIVPIVDFKIWEGLSQRQRASLGLVVVDAVPEAELKRFGKSSLIYGEIKDLGPHIEDDGEECLTELAYNQLCLLDNGKPIVRRSEGNEFEKFADRLRLSEIKGRAISIAHGGRLSDAIELEQTEGVPSYSKGDNTVLRNAISGRSDNKESVIELMLHRPRLAIVDRRLFRRTAVIGGGAQRDDFFAIRENKFNKDVDYAYRELRQAEGVYALDEFEATEEETLREIGRLVQEFDLLVFHVSWLNETRARFSEANAGKLDSLLSPHEGAHCLLVSGAGKKEYAGRPNLAFVDWEALQSEFYRASKANLVNLLISNLRKQFK